MFVGPFLALRCLDALGGETSLYRLSPDTAWPPLGTGPYAIDVRFSRDSTLLMAYDRRSVRIWDVATRRELSQIGGHPEDLTAFDVASDGDLVATGDIAGTIYLWQLPKGLASGERVTLIAKLPRPDRPQSDTLPVNSADKVLRIAVASNQSLLAAAYLDRDPRGGGKITLWDLRKREVLKELKVNGRMWQMRFVSGGRHLLAAIDWTARRRKASRPFMDVRIWDTGTYKEVGKPQRFQNACSLEFSRDGNRMAILACPVLFVDPGAPRALLVYERPGGRSSLLGTLPYSASHQIAFSPDGNLLATGSNERPRSVKLWDLATGKTVAQQELPRAQRAPPGSTTVSVDAFAPNGRVVAVSIDSGRGDDPTTTHFLWKLPQGGSLYSPSRAR